MDIREHRYEGRFVAVNRGKGLAELVQDSVKYKTGPTPGSKMAMVAG